MADDPSWDEIFASQPDAGESGVRERERPEDSRGHSAVRPRKRLTWLWVLVSAFAVLGVGAGAVFLTFEAQIRSVFGFEESNDYEGAGTGEVVVTITEGEVGGDIAQSLVEADVTKSYDAFYALLLENPDLSFQPGNYALKKQMSAQAALDALTDPSSQVVTRVTIPEGTPLNGVLAQLAELSESTGVTRDDLDVAARDVASFGLPPEAPSVEGYLFPATYSFDGAVTAKDMLQRLVDETFSRLDARGVAVEDRHRVLTIASLIEREAGSDPDNFYKVSRVILNRLDSGTLLQFDSTAQYGFALRYGEREADSVFTNEDELSDDNPYNTYVNRGLPPGPIGAPGELAVDAAINPAAGTWEYFVTVNLETGETTFSTTLAEHNAAVRQLQAWCQETQSPNCG